MGALYRSCPSLSIQAIAALPARPFHAGASGDLQELKERAGVITAVAALGVKKGISALMSAAKRAAGGGGGSGSGSSGGVPAL